MFGVKILDPPTMISDALYFEAASAATRNSDSVIPPITNTTRRRVLPFLDEFCDELSVSLTKSNNPVGKPFLSSRMSSKMKRDVFVEKEKTINTEYLF